MGNSELQQQLASTISGYRKHSIFVGIVMVLLELLHDLALMENLQPLDPRLPAGWVTQNLVVSSNLTVLVKLSTAVSWGFLCSSKLHYTIIGCFLIVVCLILCTIKTNKGKGLLVVTLQWLNLLCPCVIAVASRLISASTIIYPLGFMMLLFTVLWCIRCSILKQDYTHTYVPLTRTAGLFRPIVHLLLNSMLIFKFDVRVYLVVVLVVTMVELGLCVSSFRNLSEQLQYMIFLSRAALLMIVMARLLHSVIHPNSAPGFNLMAVCLLLFVLLERSTVLKAMFECKYHRLFANYRGLRDPTKIIVFVNLLNEKVYLRRKIIWFEFYDRIGEMQISMQLTLKKERESPDETGNQAIQRFFASKCSKKSLTALKLFLAYESIEKQQLFRAAVQLSGIDHNSLPGKVDALVLLKEIKDGNLYYSGHSNNRDEEVTCVHRHNLNKDTQSLTEQVFHLQHIIKQFTEQLLRLNEASNALTRKLTAMELPSGELCSLMMSINRQKQAIDKFIKRHRKKNMRNKQFLVCYYLYISLYCSRKYTLSEEMCEFLEVQPDSDQNRLAQLFLEGQIMNLVVSVQEEYLGCIFQADKRMMEFAGLTTQRIRQRAETINQILPSFVKGVHNELIRKYLRTGVSSFIGAINESYMCKGQYLYESQILIKLFPNSQGIMFGCSLRLLNNNRHAVVFDGAGRMHEHSVGFKSQKSNILECFPTVDLVNTKQKRLFAQLNDTHYSLELVRLNRRLFQTSICMFKEVSRGNKLNFRTYKMLVLAAQGRDIKNCESINTSVNEKHVNIRLLNKGNLESERRIHNMQANDRRLGPLNLLTALLLVGCVLATAILTYRIQSISSECNTIMQFQYALYNGFKLRNFEMSKRFALYHAINNNRFPNTLGVKYGVPDLRSYLIKKQVGYLSRLDVYDGNLIKFSKVLPEQYARIIRSNQLPYWMETGWRQSSFLSIVSNLKSFYGEVTAYNMTRFEQEWASIYKLTYYFTNNLAVELNNQIFNPVLMANEEYVNEKAANIQLEQLGWSIALCGVLVTVLVAWWRVERHKLMFLAVLRECTEGILDARHKNNLYGEELLKAVSNYCMSKFKLNLDEQIRISMECHNQLHCFMMNASPMLTEYPRETRTIRQREGNKKVLDRSETGRSLLLLSIIVTCNAIFLLYFMMTSRRLHTSNIGALDFFNKFSEGGSQVRMNEAAVLNTVVYQFAQSRANIVKSEQRYFYMLPSTQYLLQGENNIYNRNFENFLQAYSVDWPTIKNFVYSSQCASTDKLCKTMLSGAMDLGFTTSFIVFTTKAVNLYNQLKAGINTTAQVNDAYELVLTYELYLRSILSACLQYGLNITSAVVTANTQEMSTSVWSTVVPLQVLGAAMLIGYVLFIRKQLHVVKKEVMAFVDIDVMASGLLRNNQIYQYTE